MKNIQEMRDELAKPEVFHTVKYTIEHDGTYSHIVKLDPPIKRPTWDTDYYTTWSQAKKALVKYFKEYKDDYDYAFKHARKMKKSDAVNEGDL